MAEKAKKPKKPPIPVRVRTTSEPPRLAQLLIDYFIKGCKEYGRCWLNFSVDSFPKSVNHQYIHTRFNTRLDPQVMEFRQAIVEAMGVKRLQWKPTGTSAAVILLQSPYWVTKARTIREMDADNRIKPLFDAIQHATGQADERHWNFHIFKVLSKRERVTVYLFDLGDLVDYYF